LELEKALSTETKLMIALLSKILQNHFLRMAKLNEDSKPKLAPIKKQLTALKDLLEAKIDLNSENLANIRTIILKTISSLEQTCSTIETSISEKSDDFTLKSRTIFSKETECKYMESRLSYIELLSAKEPDTKEKLKTVIDSWIARLQSYIGKECDHYYALLIDAISESPPTTIEVIQRKNDLTFLRVYIDIAVLEQKDLDANLMSAIENALKSLESSFSRIKSQLILTIENLKKNNEYKKQLGMLDSFFHNSFTGNIATLAITGCMNSCSFSQ
jgi:ribosome-associated translation inhibitor RaiA